MDDVDGVAFSLKIVAKEESQRLLILDHQNLGSRAHGVRL
jgi:hypothetical protein